MGDYKLNSFPWGGAFILEASTNGNAWDTMVAKSSNGTFLGREGLATTGGNLTSGYNSVAFSDNIFSIYKPTGSYTPPTNLSSSSIPSTFLNCTITITGGNQIPVNTKNDFNVTLVPSNTSTLPYWSPPTKFNCIVKNYTSNIITFDVKPIIGGLFKIAVIVRSGECTGLISTQLLDSTIYYIPYVFTFTGTLKDNTSGNLVITLAYPTGLSSGTETIKVYYSASNADVNPVLCSTNLGTLINSSGISTVSCNILAGTYYLYIRLSNDSFTNLSVSSSTISVIGTTRFKYIKNTGITIGSVSNTGASGTYYATYTLYDSGQLPYLLLTVDVDGTLLSTTTYLVAVAGSDPAIIFRPWVDTHQGPHIYSTGDGKYSETISMSTSSNKTIIFAASASDTSGYTSVVGTGNAGGFSMWSSGGPVTLGFHASVISAEFKWSDTKLW